MQEAAEKAALGSKFAPTMLGEKRVKLTGTIIYNFKPKENFKENIKENHRFFGLGAFFPLAKIVPIRDWKSLPEMKLENRPSFKEILIPLTKISSQTRIESRLETLNQVQDSLEKTLVGNDVWQYNFGNELGGLITEIYKIWNDHSANSDKTEVKIQLSKMKTLLSYPRADIPSNILSKIKEIIALQEAMNLNSNKNKAKFIRLIVEMLNLISSN